MLMNIRSSSGDFIQMAGICLDRLLKQRSALRKPDFSNSFLPQITQMAQISIPKRMDLSAIICVICG